jgi:hypothetical protein
LAAGGAGLALHAVALADGGLALVQPLLVSGVLFALPVSSALEGRRPSTTEWLWALVLIGALATFLLASHPSAGRVSIDADVLAVTTIAGCAVVSLLILVGIRWPHGHGAALLGAGAGVGYGVTAALLKQSTAILSQGVLPLLRDWPLYTLVGVGALSIVVTQLAYRAGPLAGSMPTLTVSDPAASIAIGALAFHERLAADPIALLLEVGGLAVMLGATTQLARRSQQSPEPDATARPGALPGKK